MAKIVGLAIVFIIAFAYFQGGSRRPAPPVQAADPIADIQARLKAEQDRLRAEEDARSKSWQPTSAAAATPGPAHRPRDFPQPAGDPCATARNNAQVTSNWMREGGTVYEQGSNKNLSENETFDAAARARQFIEDNCRGR